MSEENYEQAKIIEPLAKFHARILSQNRITIPKETREVHSISAKDYVVVILRKRPNYLSKIFLFLPNFLARFITRDLCF